MKLETNFLQICYKLSFLQYLGQDVCPNESCWGAGPLKMQGFWAPRRIFGIPLSKYMYRLITIKLVFTTLLSVCIYKEKCYPLVYGMLPFVYFTFALLEITFWNEFDSLLNVNYGNSFPSRQQVETFSNFFSRTILSFKWCFIPSKTPFCLCCKRYR